MEGNRGERFFSLDDLTEECPPSAANCVMVMPADRAELQVSTSDQTNEVEFHQNYALNHDTAELKRFNAIVSAIEEVLAHYKDLPRSDCAYL